jgi:hypothetical protein
MAEKSRTIFIFSLEPWGDMWYSKHHYAAHLARSHRVYFISLPDRWRWKDLFSFEVKEKHVEEGVTILEFRNNLPLRFLPKWLANKVAGWNARKLSRYLQPGENLLWCFHPSTVADHPFLRNKASKVIYHVVDPYQNLPNDDVFARKAHLVVTINTWYLKYYEVLNPNCVLVPHGVRAEDRAVDVDAVARLKEKWGRYMVMAAGINYRTNYGLLTQVALRYPQIKLIIVGQMFPLPAELETNRRSLFALPNVVHAGVLHPNDLRHVIRGALVGLVTYDIEPTSSLPLRAEGTPLKVITYLTQSCPVVSTINSYVPDLDNKGNYKAEDEKHFLELVEQILDGRKGVEHKAVEAYLDSVEYGHLVARIFDRLDSPARNSPVPFTDGEHGSRIPLNAPILFISNEAWNGPRYSKHRYALALRAYRDVYFIDPPPQWKPAHFLRTSIVSRRAPEKITVLSYHNAIPLFGGYLSGINDRIVSRRLRKYLSKKGKTSPLIWTFDPRRLTRPADLSPCMTIYHCADDYGLRWRSERQLAERCDHVFCVAHDLMPRFRALNKSVHFAPHGLSDEDLLPSSPAPSELPARPGYGLYIGNINDRHDFELYEELFNANPDITWVFIGPMQVTDPIGVRMIHDNSHANVRFLPAVPYDDLRKIIAGSAFGFLYLRSDHQANRISSQKVVQFLAQGKPVFTSWLAEYSDRPDLVYMSDTPEVALSLFSEWKLKGDPPQNRDRRLAYSREQQYDQLIKHLPFQL